MTDLRKAAEQALEVLETTWGDGSEDALKEWKEAAKALHQALAEPANSTTGFVEPVAWIEKDKDYLAVSADPFENAIPVYTAPPKREWVGLSEKQFEHFSAYCKPEDLEKIENTLKENNA
jgi:hypothetical protein